MWNDRQELIRNNESLWRLYLKFRQGGFSKDILGEDFFESVRNSDYNVLIIGHEKSLPTEFLDAIRLFIECMPDWARPVVVKDSASEIVFGEPWRSSIRIGTAKTHMEAGGLKIGRTIQRLHITEASDPAFRDDPLIELLQTVPKNCEVVVESTAKGINNWYHTNYWAGVRGENRFTAKFVPWKVHPEYVLPVPLDFEPNEDELALMQEHGLTPEQVCWRRMKIGEFNGNVKKFKEQYPLTDTEAFLFTGSSFFSLPDLAHFLEDAAFCKDWPNTRGTLIKKDGKWLLNKHAAGQLTVFAPPVAGRTYVIGADVADGLEGGDYSVGSVWCGYNMEQVAEWHGHIDPYDFATALADLGMWYNSALLAVEDNAMGDTTIKRLFRDIFYPNLYFRERSSTVEDSSNFKRAGWHTTAPNKREIVARMAYQIANWEKTGFTPHSKEFVDECRTFAAHTDKVGMARYAAQTGCKDDRVMGACIALRLIDSWQYSTDAPNDRTDSSLVQERERQWAIEDSEHEGVSDESWLISG